MFEDIKDIQSLYCSKFLWKILYVTIFSFVYPLHGTSIKYKLSIPFHSWKHFQCFSNKDEVLYLCKIFGILLLYENFFF